MALFYNNDTEDPDYYEREYCAKCASYGPNKTPPEPCSACPILRIHVKLNATAFPSEDAKYALDELWPHWKPCAFFSVGKLSP